MVILLTHYNPLLVVLSIVVAILASYVALALANRVHQTQGKSKVVWLVYGAVAMGFGIWSMHFVGMLSFNLQGVPMAYDIPLMALSILIAVLASALALYIVSTPEVLARSLVAGGIAMAAAIAGMHYTGMFSMRMPARIHWNLYLVTASVAVALFASFAALHIAIRLRKKFSRSYQGWASVVMGIAIAGMHYTGMSAATFIYAEELRPSGNDLLATSGLALAVLVVTAIILGIAFAGSVIDRAFAIRTKNAEENSRLIAELREERELRDRFVSAVAHDLRTPLTAAMMGAELAIRKSDMPGSVQKNAGKVVETLQRMDDMVQNLLDAHRISAGQALPLQLSACDLTPFLVSVIEELTTVYGDRFTSQYDSELVGNWDAQYLRRAVENLCINAIKYGDEKTKIRLEAKKTNHSTLVLSVTNRGRVIPEEEQEKLFRLFHRGNANDTAGKRGWGLGLTIVRGIVQAHQGKVSIVSNVTHGTTFLIEIPFHPLSKRVS